MCNGFQNAKLGKKFVITKKNTAFFCLTINIESRSDIQSRFACEDFLDLNSPVWPCSNACPASVLV